MKRSTKIWIGIGALAIVGTALTLSARPRERFSDTVSFLHGQKLVSRETNVHDWSRLFPAAGLTVSETETFLIESDLASVGQMAKKQLAPLASGFASALDIDHHKQWVYAVPGKNRAENIVVNILYKDRTHTTVTVNTTKPANWLDKAGHWLGGLFGRKEPAPQIRANYF